MSRTVTGKQRKRTQKTEQSDPLDLSKWLANQPHEAIRAATMLAWAKQNGVSYASLSTCPTLERMLDAAGGNIDSLVDLIADDSRVSLKDVERVFELCIDDRRRKKQGAVYTPDYIIDYLIDHGLGFANATEVCPNFCDPACGSGGFLIRAAEILAKRHQLPLDEVVLNHIRGIDNDPWAVEHARSLLALRLLQHGGSAAQAVEQCVIEADTLLATHEEIKHFTGFRTGIDLLATNPPYVKLQNLDRAYRAKLLKRYAEFASGSFSLALLFLIAGHRLLSPGGALAYITQNNFFTSLSGKGVRRYLQSSQCIRRIVDFNHEHIFADASAYTCLVFLSDLPQPDFEYERTIGAVDGASLNKATFSSISHNTLDPAKWRLAKQPHLDHLTRIEQAGIPLGKLTKISVGFATLKDAVFHLKGEAASGGKSFRTLTGDEIEIAATKGAVKVSEIESDADAANNERRIIFPYKRQQNRWRLIPEDELKERFPKTYTYLLKHRDALAARDKGKREYEAWYAWARTQGREAPGPKLLTKTFSSRPNFMLDRSDQLFCNGYAISAPHTGSASGLCIRSLQKILNSSVMHYYAKLTSFQIDGDYQCYQKNFIERFGVPELSTSEAARLASCSGDEADRIIETWYGIPRGDILAIEDGPR